MSPPIVTNATQYPPSEQPAPGPVRGGGFFGAGLLRPRPLQSSYTKKKGYSMTAVSEADSQDETEKHSLLTNERGKIISTGLRPRAKLYPLSHEETMDLLFYLNQDLFNYFLIFLAPIFVTWALRCVRDSLVQIDPLAAAITYDSSSNKPLPTISRTPLLLQFTPFGASTNSYHVTARWEGNQMNQQPSILDGDDVTVLTDTVKGEEESAEEPKNCLQQTVKYIKILIPHIILVAVLIGYLCLGAWILMLLETRTELLARSRKLVSSWSIVNDAQHGMKTIDQEKWAATFREWMLSVSETVDDRRPIRKELNRPDDISNMHNKWTFPTALLYVLTVLTTCGYGEVSVDTDVGKVFSVVFALVGIPLMFITAADIGKFLSETLLKFVSNWNRMTRKVKQFLCRTRHGRRKSLQSSIGKTDTMDILGVDGTEEKLWFPIGAYVSCICLYCSMGSAMFINWERSWSFIHAFHFGFNLIVTVGLGDIVVKDYIFLSLIVAFVIVGLSVVTMCVDLASTHLKAYFTRIHYFGRAKRFLGMSEELKEIVALLGAMRRKKGGKVTWNDVRDFLDNELRDRPFEPHELLMKLRFIDETSSGLSTVRHNSFQSDFFRESEYIRRVQALRPEQPTFL